MQKKGGKRKKKGSAAAVPEPETSSQPEETKVEGEKPSADQEAKQEPEALSGSQEATEAKAETTEPTAAVTGVAAKPEEVPAAPAKEEEKAATEVVPPAAEVQPEEKKPADTVVPPPAKEEEPKKEVQPVEEPPKKEEVPAKKEPEPVPVPEPAKAPAEEPKKELPPKEESKPEPAPVPEVHQEEAKKKSKTKKPKEAEAVQNHVAPAPAPEEENKAGERSPESGKQPAGAPIKRKDSKFELQKGAVMYRPEFIYDKDESAKDVKMWDLMKSYLGSDTKSIQRQIVNHVEYTLARTRFNFDNNGCYYATAYSVRDRLVESWNDTYQHQYEKDPKMMYYMSLEYLLGRMLQNALVSIGQEGQYRKSLEELGYNLEEIYEEENDPGLGNGGLGRLAACFMDSLATLEYPAWGYGIRYNYGIFRQEISNGYQVEYPDYWLARGNPWEIERLDVIVPVMFYGSVRKYKDGGVERCVWEGGEVVQAMAYDIPMPGYNTFNTNNLRLWRACPSAEFDFRSFNTGDYFGAVKAKQKAESISSVLYPNDTTIEGKELRLKQEYFFCAATLEDIMNRFKNKHKNWDEFPEKVSIQLNDTHPALSVIELIRILIDVEKLTWEQAWKITCRTFSYTNHTVMMEALEKWDVDIMQRLLPRHLELIYLINHFFLESVRKVFKGDLEKLKSLSLIEEGDKKRVRMANICVVASHKVNGVAELHTSILRNGLFKDFVEYYNNLDKERYKNKFINVTNGVTPRRWLICANPKLAQLITKKIGHEEWTTDLSLVEDLKSFATDEETLNEFAAIKRENKLKLAAWVKKNCGGIDINPDSMFDVFVKRIHEYKRQLMAILYVAHRYLTLKSMKPEDRAKTVPRVFLIGGKAAPGYDAAKKTIKMATAIGDVINNDKEIGNLLKVVYLPNYSVSNAQVIIPAADLSQHISTAGTEASGTSNMKFAMNGCLIIGTMDGANVEIAREIGQENMFVFGANVEQVNQDRKMMAEGKRDYVPAALRNVLNAIFSGRFGNLGEMHEMLKKLMDGGDFYLVCWDFQSYLECQGRVDECYKKPNEWLGKAITSIACSGKFSTDRTIKEYSSEVWGINPMAIPKPSDNALSKVRSFPALMREHNAQVMC